MDDLPSLADLEAAGDAARIDFLQTDLGLCFTFAELAQTEFGMGERQAARDVLEKAETGYATIARLAQDVKNTSEKHTIRH